MLDGSYITAEDVGTTRRRHGVPLASAPTHVVGVPTQAAAAATRATFTAAGVRGGDAGVLPATLRHRRSLGRPQRRGRRAGSRRRAARAAPDSAAGAELRAGRHRRAQASARARSSARSWRDPGEALRAEVDVLAPCALGGVIDDALSDELRAGSSAARPTTSSPTTRSGRACWPTRGVLYAPDFIVNAGGLINVSLELRTTTASWR